MGTGLPVDHADNNIIDKGIWYFNQHDRTWNNQCSGLYQEWEKIIIVCVDTSTATPRYLMSKVTTNIMCYLLSQPAKREIPRTAGCAHAQSVTRVPWLKNHFCFYNIKICQRRKTIHNIIREVFLRYRCNKRYTVVLGFQHKISQCFRFKQRSSDGQNSCLCPKAVPFPPTLTALSCRGTAC